MLHCMRNARLWIAAALGTVTALLMKLPSVLHPSTLPALSSTPQDPFYFRIQEVSGSFSVILLGTAIAALLSLSLIDQTSGILRIASIVVAPPLLAALAIASVYLDAEAKLPPNWSACLRGADVRAQPIGVLVALFVYSAIVFRSKASRTQVTQVRVLE